MMHANDKMSNCLAVIIMYLKIKTLNHTVITSHTYTKRIPGPHRLICVKSR